MPRGRPSGRPRKTAARKTAARKTAARKTPARRTAARKTAARKALVTRKRRNVEISAPELPPTEQQTTPEDVPRELPAGEVPPEEEDYKARSKSEPKV